MVGKKEEEVNEEEEGFSEVVAEAEEEKVEVEVKEEDCATSIPKSAEEKEEEIEFEKEEESRENDVGEKEEERGEAEVEEERRGRCDIRFPVSCFIKFLRFTIICDKSSFVAKGEEEVEVVEEEGEEGGDREKGIGVEVAEIPRNPSNNSLS